jgi:hypothetical protein
MRDLETSMRTSVGDQVLHCLAFFDRMPRRLWLVSFPAQAVLAVQSLLWTRLLQQALVHEAMRRRGAQPAAFERDAGNNELKGHRRSRGAAQYLTHRLKGD